MTIEIITVKEEGLTLDAVLWRRFLNVQPGRLEATYERPFNLLLADSGPILPLGAQVEVDVTPQTPTSASAIESTPIRLWD